MIACRPWSTPGLPAKRPRARRAATFVQPAFPAAFKGSCQRERLFPLCSKCASTRARAVYAKLDEWSTENRNVRYPFGDEDGRHRFAQTFEEDYAGWSADFLELCRSQLHLISDSIVGVAQVALFFRKENPKSGDLEFVPLVVKSRSNSQQPDRVWISTGSATELEVDETLSTRELPGGIPAAWILPDYPFVSVGVDGGIVMQDGGLCIPVEYNDVLAGSIVLWRASDYNSGKSHWAKEEVTRVQHVARTISFGAALEGKCQSEARTAMNSRTLIETLKTLLRSSMHQIRSPISALITFGHLLLKKLPPGDSNRDLAKNIVVESLRLNELLEPLEEAGNNLYLPPNASNESRELEESESDFECAEEEDGVVKNIGALTMERRVSTEAELESQEQGNESVDLIWVSDILEPIANSATYLAQANGHELHVDIDGDTPAILGRERDIREAIYNFVNNAFRYTKRNGHVGMQCKLGNTGNEVEIVIWDSGMGISESEMQDIWKKGFRGSAAAETGADGCGLGLAIAKEIVQKMGGSVHVQSPLPEHLDPRSMDERENAKGGSAFCITFPRAALE